MVLHPGLQANEFGLQVQKLAEIGVPVDLVRMLSLVNPRDFFRKRHVFQLEFIIFVARVGQFGLKPVACEGRVGHCSAPAADGSRRLEQPNVTVSYREDLPLEQGEQGLCHRVEFAACGVYAGNTHRRGQGRMEIFTAEGFAALLQVMMIDLVLAGDNAIVIGLAAAGLPKDQRAKAILVGIIAATVLRIFFATITVQLLAITGLLLAGGILLLWVCWKMWRELRGAMRMQKWTRRRRWRTPT